MKYTKLTDSIFTIDAVLSADECRATMARAESIGFEIATINAWDGPRVDTNTRNNDRVIIDDVALAYDIWGRVADHVPSFRSGRQVRGLNERFRYLSIYARSAIRLACRWSVCPRKR